MASLLLFLLPAVFGLLIPHPAAATNYLLSGETLDADGHLTNGDYDLVMQRDCNLVLYNGHWQSNTANGGLNCKLTLTNQGELAIVDALIVKDEPRTVWSSGKTGPPGEYVFIIQDNGYGVVYGPSIWSTSSTGSMKKSIDMVTGRKAAK